MRDPGSNVQVVTDGEIYLTLTVSIGSDTCTDINIPTNLWPTPKLNCKKHLRNKSGMATGQIGWNATYQKLGTSNQQGGLLCKPSIWEAEAKGVEARRCRTGKTVWDHLAKQTINWDFPPGPVGTMINF